MNITIKNLKDDKQLKEILGIIENQFTTDADEPGKISSMGEFGDYEIHIKKTGNMEIEVK